MAEQTFAFKFKLHSNCDGKRCLCPHRIMPAKGRSKKASPKKGQVCSCAMSKATTCDKELGCGNCNRKMTSQKWAKVKKNEDIQWGEEAQVKASKVGGGGEAESEVTPGGKETPRGEETPGGDDDTEGDEEEEEEEVEEKKVGAKKRAKGAAEEEEEEEEEEQIQDEGLAKDVGEDEGLVLLFCS